MASLDYLPHARKIFYKRGALPEQVTFFVTPKCNARCKQCFAWKTLQDNEKDILTIEEIKKISKSMEDFTYLLIGGGEPFLRDDLAEIVDIFYRNNNLLNIAISTNGSFPQTTIKVVKEIMKNFRNNFTINVSLDAIGHAHDEIRQLPGIFEKATDTYRQLKELKVKYPNLNAGIIMTCTPFNHKELSNTYIWLKRNLKPYSIVLNYMRGDVKDKERLPEIELSAYNEVMDMIERDVVSGQICGHGNFFLADLNLASKMLMRRMVSSTVKTDSFQSPCYAGILNCVLWCNGDVYPCEMLDKKIGSLRQCNYNFKQLWVSDSARKIRSFIKDSKCFCTEECNINMNILFNLRYLPWLLSNVARIKISRLFMWMHKCAE